MFVPVIKHVINTSLQKENYLSDDCGWLPWLCGNHVTMTTITFKKKRKKRKTTHTLLGWSYRHHPAAECPSSVCLWASDFRWGACWVRCDVTGQVYTGSLCVQQRTKTRMPWGGRLSGGTRIRERERESRQDVQTLQKGMLGNPQRGKGRGGEADRVSPLTVWHSWMWDGNPRQTDSWGQTAALSLWPQQPTELKTRCCSSTNVHQRPPKC